MARVSFLFFVAWFWHATKAEDDYYYCTPSATSNSITYDSDRVYDGVRIRLIGAQDDRRRRRTERRLTSPGATVACGDSDYDFVNHCKIGGTNFDSSSDSSLTHHSDVATIEDCFALCAQLWNDGITGNKCETLQWHDNGMSNNCVLSTRKVTNPNFVTVAGGDSHHWCWAVSASACFENPDLSGVDNADPGNTNCVNTADGGTCSYACASGYTASNTLTCDVGFWTGTASCTPNPCTNNPDLSGIDNADAGNTNCQNTAHGGTCTYACESGYAATNNLTCIASSWTGLDQARCSIDAETCVLSRNTTTSAVFDAVGGSCDVVDGTMLNGQTCSFSRCAEGKEWNGETSEVGAMVVRCSAGNLVASGWSCKDIPPEVEGVGVTVIAGVTVASGAGALSFLLGFQIALPLQLLVALIIDSMQFFVALSVLGGRASSVHRYLADEFSVVLLNETSMLRPMANAFEERTTMWLLPTNESINATNDTSSSTRQLRRRRRLDNASDPISDEETVETSVKWWSCDEDFWIAFGDQALEQLSQDQLTKRNLMCVQTSPVWITILAITFLGFVGALWAFYRTLHRCRTEDGEDTRPRNDAIEMSSSGISRRGDKRTNDRSPVGSSSKQSLAERIASNEPNYARLLQFLLSRTFVLSYLPACIAYGYFIGFVHDSPDGGSGLVVFVLFSLTLYVFVPPIVTLAIYVRERDQILKVDCDQDLSEYDEKVGGNRWYHRLMWTETTTYHWGLLWPCVDFWHRFLIGATVGLIQWSDKIAIYNFLLIFGFELTFVILIVKLEPFRDRVYYVIKILLHAINITASGMSVGYVSSTDTDTINDVGLTVVWLFFSAWIIAIVGLLYLLLVLPLLRRAGVKCVQPKKIRDRSKLQDEVAKEQEKLESKILGKIGSDDLVVDMRSVELGVKLGRGGSGIVYKALMSDTPVVAKSLISNMVMEEVDEFLREAAMLAKLRHPNVCAFYGIGIRDNVLYLVQEYCNSGSLRQFRESSEWTHSKMESFVGQLFRTMSYLHSRRVPVIHRDIKPDNLLIHEASILKVGDLGTSKEQGETREEQMMTANMTGTVHYMPPEALRHIYRDKRASIKPLDGRKDPFSDMSAITVARRVADEDIKPKVSSRKVPWKVGDLIRAMYATDPKRRPTMKEATSMYREAIKSEYATSSSRDHDDDAEGSKRTAPALPMAKKRNKKKKKPKIPPPVVRKSDSMKKKKKKKKPPALPPLSSNRRSASEKKKKTKVPPPPLPPRL